jgi:hypothetical protein
MKKTIMLTTIVSWVALSVSANEQDHFSFQIPISGPAVIEYETVGNIETELMTTYSAEQAGKVESVLRKGVLFDIGDTLVKLNDTLTTFEYQKSLFQERSLESQISITNIELQQLSSLINVNSAAQIDVDRKEGEKNKLELSLLESQAYSASIAHKIQQTHTQAGYGGVVVNRHKNVGEHAEVGDNLITVMSMRRARVSVTLPSTYLRDIDETTSLLLHLPEQVVKLGVGGVIPTGKNTITVVSKSFNGESWKVSNNARLRVTVNMLSKDERYWLHKSAFWGSGSDHDTTYVLGKAGNLTKKHLKVTGQLGDFFATQLDMYKGAGFLLHKASISVPNSVLENLPNITPEMELAFSQELSKKVFFNAD